MALQSFITIETFCHILIKEGVATLCGNEESVYKDFQEDRQEWKFSKERAVKLFIHLVEKR